MKHTQHLSHGYFLEFIIHFSVWQINFILEIVKTLARWKCSHCHPSSSLSLSCSAIAIKKRVKFGISQKPFTQLFSLYFSLVPSLPYPNVSIALIVVWHTDTRPIFTCNIFHVDLFICMHTNSNRVLNWKLYILTKTHSLKRIEYIKKKVNFNTIFLLYIELLLFRLLLTK